MLKKIGILTILLLTLISCGNKEVYENVSFPNVSATFGNKLDLDNLSNYAN